MNIKGWRYYNFAAVPDVSPHEEANLSPIQDKTIWELTGHPYLARWISDWDKMEESEFYYCIKDDKFDISKIKAKYRYEINRGKKSFFVKIIDPKDYKDEIYDVYLESLEGHPKGTVPDSKESMDRMIDTSWSKDICRFFAAFETESGKMCGYSDLFIHGKYINFSSFHTRVSKEKAGINFALANGIIEWFNTFDVEGAYISDGSRNVYHATNFQNFLIKYFGFRKAYCTLHIVYKPIMKTVVYLAFPLRKQMYKIPINKIKQLSGVLKMEAWQRGLPE